LEKYGMEDISQKLFLKLFKSKIIYKKYFITSFVIINFGRSMEWKIFSKNYLL